LDAPKIFRHFQKGRSVANELKFVVKDKVLKLHKTDKKTVVVESEDQLQANERMIDAIKKY
jgi:prophage tail gpP-like protein